jgi:hypothetical protein
MTYTREDELVVSDSVAGFAIQAAHQHRYASW